MTVTGHAETCPSPPRSCISPFNPTLPQALNESLREDWLAGEEQRAGFTALWPLVILALLSVGDMKPPEALQAPPASLTRTRAQA